MTSRRWLRSACLLLAASLIAASTAEARARPKQCVDENGAVLADSIVDAKQFRGRGKKIESPKALSTPEPEWPKSDATCRVPSSVVKITFIIRESGSVCGVELLDRLPRGCERQQEAILSTLRGWKYEPARIDGAPVAVQYLLRLDFK